MRVVQDLCMQRMPSNAGSDSARRVRRIWRVAAREQIPPRRHHRGFLDTTAPWQGIETVSLLKNKMNKGRKKIES